MTLRHWIIGLALGTAACAAVSPAPDEHTAQHEPAPKTHAASDAPKPSSAPEPGPAPKAEPWAAASARFRSNGGWLGADSAYSVPLDDTHVLWLFADTFLDPTRDGTRENGPNYFIRNSVGIQSGPTPEAAHDLASSALTFHWGPVQNAAPTSFFRDIDGSERWVWPLHGARLPGGELLVFRMQVAHEAGGLGFRVDSWDAIAIDDPLAPPQHWKPRVIAPATKQHGKLVGSSVLVHDGHLYAYAVDNTGGDHAISLARWSLAQLAGLRDGVLADPEWWTGEAFVRQSALPEGARPGVLFGGGQVELSVHYDAAQKRFVEVQMAGLFVSDAATQVGRRVAPQPEGPWSALQPLHRPAESSRDNAADLVAYAAKLHPEQRGGDAVVTYMVNDLKRFPPADAL
ncbi:MAG: hypothetical protein ABW321_25770 [Polyangiales bacterium]